MFPLPPALLVTDGVVTVITTTAGSVPGTAVKLGAMALAQNGRLYVIQV